MSRARRLSRNANSYRRRAHKNQASGRTFLIVTEGSQSEPEYLKALCNELNLSAVNVEIVHPEGTDPKTLVQEAIKLRKLRKKEAKKGYTVEYDEVWVVFDLEGPHDQRRQLAREARDIAGASAVQFAESDPCFEFWLLLHETYSTRQFQDCQELVKRLKQLLPAYSKVSPLPRELLKKTPIAVGRAQRCRDHHRTCNGDGNPSTELDRLVRVLNKATRPHFQYEFD